MKGDTIAQMNIFFIFVVSNLLALALLPVYMNSYVNESENNNPWMAVFYILYIIGITAVILYIVKLKKINILKGIFYFAVAWTMWFALIPIFFFFSIPFPSIVSLSLAVIISIILAKYPEWYVLDISGVLMTVGISLIIGIALGPVPVILLLSLLAIYDAISVYKTKHMVSLADNVIQHNLPALFVIPTKSKYSYRKVKSVTNKSGKNRVRDAYYMGFGDVMIPGILVIVAARNFGVLSGIFTLAGALAAMILLTAMVNTGKPQPGLPYLNGGALAGLLAYLLFLQ